MFWLPEAPTSQNVPYRRAMAAIHDTSFSWVLNGRIGEGRGESRLGRVVERQPPADTRAEGQDLRGAESFGQSGVAGEDDAEQLFAIGFTWWPRRRVLYHVTRR
jgi:hypothetical protein